MRAYARAAAALLLMAVASTLGVVFYEGLANVAVFRDLTSTTSPTTSSSSADASSLCGTDNDDDGTSGHSAGATNNITSTVPRLNDRSVELSPCVYRPWVLLDVPRADNTSSGGSGDATETAPPTAHGLIPRWFRRSTTRRDEGRGSMAGRPPPTLTRTLPRAPPYRVVLTNFGWNHPDQSVGRNVTRSVRSSEFVAGIVNHPYFDPVDWDELNRRVVAKSKARRTDDVDTDTLRTRYYVFLDVETCYESNYPVYGGGPAKNLDSAGGRVDLPDRIAWGCYMAPTCPAIRRVLESPLFRRHPNLTKLLFFDCRGYSMTPTQRQQLLSKQFAVMSYSAGIDQHDPSVDQGLPPPAVTKIVLTETELRDIETCDAERNRTHLFSFVGSVRNAPRAELVKLHDPSIGIVAQTPDAYRKDLDSGAATSADFADLLRQSVFAGAPIGDNRFSYRFAEVLAAGAIPVVHSDGWVLPFRPELVDWSECLLHLPEATINQTIAILRNVTLERRCQMRRRCREIYAAYMQDAAGTIRGVLDGLELLLGSKRRGG